MVRKYYDHGLTLEETADRLFVSEEYLSSQFKKETGRGFKETVRHYRIERIKDLLMNTSLKLNQIAELTGYADPKYMTQRSTVRKQGCFRMNSARQLIKKVHLSKKIHPFQTGKMC